MRRHASPRLKMNLIKLLYDAWLTTDPITQVMILAGAAYAAVLLLYCAYLLYRSLSP